MAKFVVCPTCEAQVDVSQNRPGTKIDCPGCGGDVAVPRTSETQAITQAVKAPVREQYAAEPPPPPTRRKIERMTPIMRKMAGSNIGGGNRPPRAPPAPRPSSSNKGLMIGLAVAGVVGVIGLIAVMSNQNKQTDKKADKKPTVIEAPVDETPVPGATFETNAKLMIRGQDAPTYELDPGTDRKFREKALAGNHQDLITKDDAILNLKIAFTHLIGEDEKLARASYDFLQAFYTDPRFGGKLVAPKIPSEHFNRASVRSKVYVSWAAWPTKEENIKEVTAKLDPNASKTDDASNPGKVEVTPDRRVKDVSDATWEEWMVLLRLGARDGELGKGRNEALSNIIAWGRPGIERLISYLGDEDLGKARAAGNALNDIVVALPPERGGGKKYRTDDIRPANQAAVKAQWTEWFKRDYKDPE